MFSQDLYALLMETVYPIYTLSLTCDLHKGKCMVMQGVSAEHTMIRMGISSKNGAFNWIFSLI